MKLNSVEGWTLIGLLAAAMLAYCWIRYSQRAASRSSGYVPRVTSRPIDEHHPRPTFAELAPADLARLDAQRAVVLAAAKHR